MHCWNLSYEIQLCTKNLNERKSRKLTVSCHNFWLVFSRKKGLKTKRMTKSNLTSRNSLMISEFLIYLTPRLLIPLFIIFFKSDILLRTRLETTVNWSHSRACILNISRDNLKNYAPKKSLQKLKNMKIMRGCVKLAEIVAFSLRNSQIICAYYWLRNLALYLHHFLKTKGSKQGKNRSQ